MDKSGEEVGFMSKLRHKFAKKSRQEVAGGGDTRSLDKELSPKQKKIWLAGLFGTLILIVGLLIAIVVVVNVGGRQGEVYSVDESQNEELVEREKRELELQAAMEQRNAVLSAINEVMEASVDANEDTVVAAYQYYISEEDNELAKLMLRLDLVTVEANYDLEKARGNELIAVAKELDGELKTINSAVAIMNMAAFYGDNGLLEEYNTILTEREKATGINVDDNSEGETKG